MNIKFLVISLFLGVALLCAPLLYTDSSQSTSVGDVGTGSTYKENYVYGAAMNLAWNDLAESILQGAIDTNVETSSGKKLAKVFNSAPFTKQDLDDASYYIKSGYGQKTVEAINKESRAKFPEKSFGDLTTSLADKDIIAYAYFLKKVEYPTEFTEKDISFKGFPVKGFYVQNSGQRENIGIVRYDDDDHFILKMKLKDTGDEMYLAKGYNLRNPNKVVKAINESSVGAPEAMRSDDVFEMPKLHLDHKRSYDELAGAVLKNKGFEGYKIQSMLEKIKFDLDHKGARVENEASITVEATFMQRPAPHKNFILDKPFFVVMKRELSSRPYFVLGVKNAEVMHSSK